MILYLDCSSGVSGDMLVAALLSLAGDTERQPRTLDAVVRPALKAAGIDRRLVSVYEVRRGGVDALTFRVPEGPGFTTFDELIMAMYASHLEQRVADRVAALSQRMAAAEAEVHGPHVHLELDELGGLDTAVDLISAVSLIQHLAPQRIVASPPALGGGTVEISHGEVDVPAPAVAVLLRGLPTAPLDPTGRLGELTTPTGAALLAHYVQDFGAVPPGRITATGIGAGTREVPGQANVLRAFLIEPVPQEATMQHDPRDSRDYPSDPGAVRLTPTGIAGGVRRSVPDDLEPDQETTAAFPAQEVAAAAPDQAGGSVARDAAPETMPGAAASALTGEAGEQTGPPEEAGEVTEAFGAAREEEAGAGAGHRDEVTPFWPARDARAGGEDATAPATGEAHAAGGESPAAGALGDEPAPWHAQPEEAPGSEASATTEFEAWLAGLEEPDVSVVGTPKADAPETDVEQAGAAEPVDELAEQPEVPEPVDELAEQPEVPEPVEEPVEHADTAAPIVALTEPVDPAEPRLASAERGAEEADVAAAAAAAAPAARSEAPAPAATPSSGSAPADEPVQTQEAHTMPADDHAPLDHVVLEANIDDMSPELLAHAAEMLREAGALDVWMTQALMKKGRPGVVLHVLGESGERQRLADIIFAETTTFGVRVLPVGRIYAKERRETIKLGGFDIRVRLSLMDGRPATVAPEYEDCRRAAERLRRPVKVIYEAAQAAARARFSGS
jgi:uncharacterized protein (DUF111 family)